MKAALLDTLKSTLIGDNVKLSEASDTLIQMSNSNGFCISLMEIVDDQSIQIPIKQAALIQLKNTIKLKWKVKNEKDVQILDEEKNMIRNSLVMAVIRCAKIHQLIKLYREVITIIVNHDSRSWLPVNEIVSYLEKNQYLEACLQCLIAIASNFEFSVIPKDRQFFNELILFILPKLIIVLKNNMANPQLVYLSLKFFWKSIHYDLSKQSKMICLDWMEILHNTITAFNETCQMKVDQFHHKYTLQFYYFHSKKWATRIILRFLQKHAKDVLYGHELIDNKEFTKKWHEEYGPVFLKAIIEQMRVPTIKKVRYFQFKCIQTWTIDRSHLIKEYANLFQYQILPQYLKLKPEDEAIANSDPTQYLAIEEEPSLSFTNLKRAATDLWIAMLQIESKTDPRKNIYHPGIYFNENLNFLINNLNSANLLEKQFSMYMLCEIRYIIVRVKEAYQKLLQILPSLVIPEFENQVMFLRMRANDIFVQYGRQNYSIEIIEKIAAKIYTCLSSDSNPLVRIKAASAFHNILIHPNARGLVLPLLKDILEIYLKLIENYDIEQLVKGLEHIVSNFANEISPYAIDLFKYLSHLFIKLFNKDMEQNKCNEDYEGQTELTASGCLKTMAQIISSPLSQQMRNQLEDNVLEMCYFVLCQESVDYSEDILSLLNVHIYKINQVSFSLWFFFQVVIYFLVGIPQEFWGQLEKTNMPEKYKKLLMNLKESQNIQYFQYAVPVIRNYINKGVKLFSTQSSEFKLNFVHIQFYLVGSTYKLHSKDITDGELDLDCCAILLIYLVEACDPSSLIPMLSAIWSYCKFNFVKSKTCCLRSITSMLVGVLFWKLHVEFVKILLNENLLPFCITEMIKYHNHLHDSHEKKRIILGSLTLLALPEKPEQLQKQIPNIFKMTTKMIKSNARQVIIKFMEKNKLKNQQVGINTEQQNEEQIYDLPDDDEVEYSDEEEDYWDEGFYNNYVSPLDSHSQFTYYKEVMERIKQEINVVQIIPEGQLTKVMGLVDKALIIIASSKTNR